VQRVPAPRYFLHLFVPTKWNTVDGHDESDLQSPSHGFGVAVPRNFARYDFWQTDVLDTFFHLLPHKLVPVLSVYFPATLHITNPVTTNPGP